MKTRARIVAIIIAGCAAGVAALYLDGHGRVSIADAQSLPAHQIPIASDGVVVELCDGKTSTVVKGLKPGQAMSHEQALAVTSGLMADWQRKHPDQHWEMAQAGTAGPSAAPTLAPMQGVASSAGSIGSGAAGGSAAAGAAAPVVAPANAQPSTSQQGDTYASFHERDYKIWQAETD